MSNLQFQSFTNQNFDMSDEGRDSGGGGFGGRIGDKPLDEQTTTAGPKRNFFSFGYYQQFFDVDTEQVTKRLLNSAIPTTRNFITEFVQPIPDLYGPFWVCTTLVFSIAMFANFAQFIENKGATAGAYGSDFGMVTGASSLIAAYVLIIPAVLSTLMWYRKTDIQYSFLEVLCAYGYSLAIFIPVSMLWVIDINALRWGLIFASVALSGGVLVRALWPAFQNDPNKLLALGTIAGVVLLHFGLALCFKEYFFDAAMPSRPIPLPDVAASTMSAPAAITANTTDLLAVAGDPAAVKKESKVEEAKKPEAASLLAASNVDPDAMGGGNETETATTGSDSVKSAETKKKEEAAGEKKEEEAPAKAADASNKTGDEKVAGKQ